MSEVDDLRRVLARHTQADVTLTYERFRQRMPSSDLGQFVDYMVGEGLLSPEAAARAAAELRAASDDKTIAERIDPVGAGSGTRPDAGAAVPAPRVHASNLRLFEVIGRGGMGVVYRGEQVELGRKVAFKQLLAESNETQRERFVREARITAQLDHPNIVPVHALELPDGKGGVGYAMKLVEGKTLRTLLAECAEAYERGLPIDEEHSLGRRLDIFLKICDALALAHARGVIHRDLKPANFMVGAYGEVYVMDWGVARPIGAEPPRDAPGAPRFDHDADLTQDGDIIGSPAYMSPEQADARNDELDASSDQYALGLILFEMVSLQRAMVAATTIDMFTLAAKGTKVPLRHVSKDERIPRELSAIVARATAFLPADRYPSVSALADDVRRYLRGDAVDALPDGPLGKLWRAMVRHRRTTLSVMFALVAIAAVTVMSSRYRAASQELESRARGERVTALYGDVATQAHRIDAELRGMEEALEGLRTAAEFALTGPEPIDSACPSIPRCGGSSLRVYLDTDFADPQRRPADFTDQTAYRWPVSVEHPVVGIAPGTDRVAVEPKLRRLAVLRGHMRDMVVRAGGREPTEMSVAEKNAYLLSRKSPIDYTYVDTPEGIHYMLPGMDALPRGYDVRTAGFYTMSAQKRGRRWGRPYVDSTTDEQGDDLVLPCTQGLWSPSGEYLGVAGVEITVTKMVETGLVLPGRQTIRTSLLNERGEKVIDSFDAGKRFKPSGKDEGLELFPFDEPEIVEAVKKGSDGVRRIRKGGRDVLVVFVRVDVLGWFYVVEVDASAVEGG